MFGKILDRESLERSLDGIEGWSACVGLSRSSACEIGEMGWPDAGIVLGAGLLILLCAFLFAKLRRTLVVLRARSFTPEISRLLAPWVKTNDYSQEAFFTADGADQATAAKRRRALDRLADHFQEHHSQSIAWGDKIRDGLSDLRFTDAGRVPFPFAKIMREKFNLCSVVTTSQGPMLRDLDGNWSLDVTGSYGVNVAGYDQYKEWMERGWERVKDLGPVLGPLHPIVAENIAMLKSISKLDEVSFHMSGT
ncbi:MAG: hypothetical protein NNA21_10540, partial [Nitrospira sp.]|nr:hypothetical protein [Nitrospira sp.]